MTRREFLYSSTAAVTCGAVAAGFAGEEPRGIRLRFLGSGASNWKPEWVKDNPHMRRQSSVLLDGRVLIDFTPCSFDFLPDGCRPEALFQTHSHGGIPGDAARMVGIDAHVNESNYARFRGNPFVRRPEPITAFVMEATNGDLDEDFRVFVHSSVQTVARIVNALKATGRYTPPEGQCACLTHLGLKYRGWPSEKIDAELPPGLRAASDGLELVLG